MIIFLRNIPIDTKKYEIASFIEPVFNDCFLVKATTRVSLQDIEILAIKDIDSDVIEKHALIRIVPEEVAKRVIKHIDGTVFKNTPVSAREYINRSSTNDPRHSALNEAAELLDRRLSDRRRKPLLNSWQKYPILVHTAP
ncbi:hypothetical protein [Methylomicrobium lacus]|uniref:hypothetical protein n=1 Tax=Methylomicrobium lacus TaxID=136992 RepID=UPI00045E82C4|nr:hypothetical protein [Methylomicrobium lacus]